MSTGACNFAQVFEDEQKEIVSQSAAPGAGSAWDRFFRRRHPQRVRCDRCYAEPCTRRDLEARPLSLRHLGRNVCHELAYGMDPAHWKLFPGAELPGLKHWQRIETRRDPCAKIPAIPGAGPSSLPATVCVLPDATDGDSEW